MYEVGFNTVKFVYAPMYTYNEFMCLLELAGVVEVIDMQGFENGIL